jgi:hypothetical protein
MGTIFCAEMTSQGLMTSCIPPNDLILQAKVSAIATESFGRWNAFNAPGPPQWVYVSDFQEEEGR